MLRLATLLCLAASAFSVSSEPASNQALLDAIADGGPERVQSLLERGADVNARDADGTTVLMHAVVTADVDLMKTLLDKGADPNAKNTAGATALMWAVGDFSKVRLLVERGADVNARARSGFTPLLIAANSEATAETIELLLKKGAKADAATNSGYSAVMAAAGIGDPAIVDLLLRHGANARAKNVAGYSALHAAAFGGSPEVVKLLLDGGADADPKDNSQGRTPLIWAAQRGQSGIVRQLLRHGASVNARETLAGTTALMNAAAEQSGNAATVEALLAQGADTSTKDFTGATALDWADRQGYAATIDLLKKHGAARGSGNPQAPEPASGPKDRTRDQAVKSGLALLQGSGPKFLDNSTESCMSCHHQALPAMSVSLARRHGFEVNERLALAERKNMHANFTPRRERLLQGIGIPDLLDAGYLLAGFNASGQPRDSITDALVHYLTLKQTRDGRWRTMFHRPPMDDGDFTTTALSLHSLKVYGPPGRAVEIHRRIEHAREWLMAAAPRTTEDRCFRLLGLAWSNADKGLIQKAASELLATQRKDGGWAQLATLASDAYATGQALVALHQASNVAATDPAYRRGVRYLRQKQLADGSWFVPTRSIPVQPYFESGFPHGRSQFISCAATAWATMALALTAEERRASRP
jgi:ankyrin repeat protein